MKVLRFIWKEFLLPLSQTLLAVVVTLWAGIILSTLGGIVLYASPLGLPSWVIFIFLTLPMLIGIGLYIGIRWEKFERENQE